MPKKAKQHTRSIADIQNEINGFYHSMSQDEKLKLIVSINERLMSESEYEIVTKQTRSGDEDATEFKVKKSTLGNRKKL